MTKETLDELSGIRNSLKHAIEEKNDAIKIHNLCSIALKMHDIISENHLPELSKLYKELHLKLRKIEASTIDESFLDRYCSILFKLQDKYNYKEYCDKLEQEKVQENIVPENSEFKQELEDIILSATEKFNWYSKESNALYLGLTKKEIQNLQENRKIANDVLITNEIPTDISNEAISLNMRTIAVEPDKDFKSIVEDAISIKKFGCDKESLDNSYGFEEK